VAEHDQSATKDVLNATQNYLAAIKNPPFFHTCGAHYAGLSINKQTISYSSLLYSSTNTDCGDLDISILEMARIYKKNVSIKQGAIRMIAS
jgi:hypothetical protein